MILAKVRFDLNSWANRPYTLVAGGCLLCLVNILTRFPGESNPDSDSQYRQILSGVYDDWHPPIMARLWSFLRLFGDGTGPIFMFHIVLYWLSFTIIALALLNAGRIRSAYAILVLGLLPPSLMLTINIAKDVGLSVVLLAAFALAFRYRSKGQPIPLWAKWLVGALVIYGALVRGNAVFAVGPIVIFLFSYPWQKISLVRVAILSIAIAALLIPVSTAINRYVLLAKSAGSIKSIELFDLAGISRLTDDDTVLQQIGISHDDIRRCYSPIMWDSIVSRCPAVSEYFIDQGAPNGPDLSQTWISAVLSHPVPYTIHRILAFNSTIFFAVPNHHTEFVRVLPSDARRGSSSFRKLLDLIHYNVLTSAATILALNISLMLASRYFYAEDRIAKTTLILLSSSLLYSGSFFPFGVATDQRYFLWPMLAVLTSLIIVAPNLRLLAKQRPGLTCLTLSPVFMVLIIELLFRWTNSDMFLFTERML